MLSSKIWLISPAMARITSHGWFNAPIHTVPCMNRCQKRTWVGVRHRPRYVRGISTYEIPLWDICPRRWQREMLISRCQTPFLADPQETLSFLRIRESCVGSELVARYEYVSSCKLESII